MRHKLLTTNRSDWRYRASRAQYLLTASRQGQDKRGRRRSAAIPPNELPWENVNNMWQTIANYGTAATCDKMWQSVATRADLERNMATCVDLRPFCKNPVCPNPVWKPVSEVPQDCHLNYHFILPHGLQHQRIYRHICMYIYIYIYICIHIVCIYISLSISLSLSIYIYMYNIFTFARPPLTTCRYAQSSY